MKTDDFLADYERVLHAAAVRRLRDPSGASDGLARRAHAWSRPLAARRRRDGRRWLGVVALAGALGAWIVLAPSSAPERERPAATPTVHTVKTTPLPTPEPITGPPLIVEANVLEHAEALFAAEGGTSNGTLERAWSTPGMQGEDAHVFLFRRGDQRCLSVPDPGGLEAGDRGVGCSPADVFERFGVSTTVGSNYAAVVPDPTGRPPMYRHADGTRETPKLVAGLLALARTEPGSAVALYAPDGKRRTDAFRLDQRGGRQLPSTRYECSDGRSVIAPADIKFEDDPCTATAKQQAESEKQSHIIPRRGG
jgi:hypothetical protein